MADRKDTPQQVPAWVRNSRETHPYLYEYVRIHGTRSFVSMWETGPYKTQEDVYRAALEKGVTWEELLNYDENKSREYVP